MSNSAIQVSQEVQSVGSYKHEAGCLNGGLNEQEQSATKEVHISIIEQSKGSDQRAVLEEADDSGSKDSKSHRQMLASAQVFPDGSASRATSDLQREKEEIKRLIKDKFVDDKPGKKTKQQQLEQQRQQLKRIIRERSYFTNEDEAELAVDGGRHSDTGSSIDAYAEEMSGRNVPNITIVSRKKDTSAAQRRHAGFEDGGSVCDTSSLNTHQQAEETERQLVKYEADIRQHISIEQQLQIYIESMKQKLEDLEKENVQLKRDLEGSKAAQAKSKKDSAADQQAIDKLRRENVTLSRQVEEKTESARKVESEQKRLKQQLQQAQEVINSQRVELQLHEEFNEQAAVEID